MIKKISTTLAVTSALLLTAASAQAAITELVTNGGFETGDFSGWTQGIGGTQSISAVNPSSGASSAFLSINSPAANVLKQNLGAGLLTAGQAVNVSFDYRGTATAGGVLFAELHSIDGLGGVSQTLTLNGGGPLFPNADPDVWSTYTFTANLGPDVDGGVDILLNAPCGAAAGCVSDYFIDNISVTADVAAVPVPAAAWLFGSSLLGLVGMAKRKK